MLPAGDQSPVDGNLEDVPSISTEQFATQTVLPSGDPNQVPAHHVVEVIHTFKRRMRRHYQSPPVDTEQVYDQIVLPVVGREYRETPIKGDVPENINSVSVRDEPVKNVVPLVGPDNAAILGCAGVGEHALVIYDAAIQEVPLETHIPLTGEPCAADSVGEGSPRKSADVVEGKVNSEGSGGEHADVVYQEILKVASSAVTGSSSIGTPML